ncbi:hypothetical protein AO391_16310 [Pseudomonas marginalis ICMP 9505]|nr:hypothetical protein AO391_16310 [Pseudomonas marginalis ICMP 9505]
MSFVIIECGSVARGDTNENSDLDLVCIWSGRRPDFKSIVMKYGDVSFYSTETIRRMRNKGSLFLTHLDVDSKFISGDEKLLLEFKGFRPPYDQIQNLLKETTEFIASIDWFPRNDIGRLWLCDLLYVSLRSCIYCKNALDGIFVFGFLDALQACKIPQDEIKTLLALRDGKYAYRKKRLDNSFSFDIEQIELACKFVIGAEVSFHQGGHTVWSEIGRNDYWGERLVERAILNGEHCDDLFMSKMIRHNYNKSSLKLDVLKIVNMHLV